MYDYKTEVLICSCLLNIFILRSYGHLKCKRLKTKGS